MTDFTSPESIVQRQLDAYNARDVDALLATYAEDVQQFEYPATLLCSGAAVLRERMTARLSDPLLHARLINRIVMGNTVNRPRGGDPHLPRRLRQNRAGGDLRGA